MKEKKEKKEYRKESEKPEMNAQPKSEEQKLNENLGKEGENPGKEGEALENEGVSENENLEKAILECEQTKEKLNLANDKYLRLQAEFDNYRKRTARERMDLVLTASEDVIKGLLPVLDDCERAMSALDASIEREGISEEEKQAGIQAKEGVNLIYRKLYKYLETKGLKPVEAKGLALDTDKHSAIAQIPAPDAGLKGKIVDVVLQGYTLNGKVIRFANVVVGI